MTENEQKYLKRGLIGGAIMGLALGGIVLLFIALNPDVFSPLIQ